MIRIGGGCGGNGILKSLCAAVALFAAAVATPAGNLQAAVDTERLTVGGEIRARYEFRNNADFSDAVNDTLSFTVTRVRLHLAYEITPDIGFFLQMQDSRLFGSETSTASNEKNLDLHQGYLTVKNLAGPLTLILGRQEMVFGDSRLVGNFGWSNIGRSFDGLRFTYDLDPLRADLWATVTRTFGTNTGADPAFTPSNRDAQQFFGLYTSVNQTPFTIEPYVMYLRDTGPIGTSLVTDPLAPSQSRVTLGLRFDGKAVGDTVDFTGEGAYQTGTMAARGATPESDISAYALAVKAGYTLPVPFSPRIGIEYDRASGDNNPNDDKVKTFENLFPTNHLHYGYMDYVAWRNIQDLRFSVRIKPTPTSAVSLDYHRLALAEKRDNWYRASGAVFRTTPGGNSESDLGEEIDLIAYATVKEKLRLEAGYGRFFPGDYVKVNFPSASDGSDFVYLQATTGF